MGTAEGTPKSREADLAVVGGGIAALAAALEARRLGMEVVLVCKRRAGRSGNSIVAAGNLSLRRKDLGDTAFTADIQAVGRDICDSRLASRFAAESAAVVEFLETTGVKLSRRNGELLWKRIPGHSLPRSVAIERQVHPVALAGLSLTVPLRDAAVAAGAILVDAAPAVHLLTRDGVVVGLVVDPPGAPAFCVRAGSVLLATGGYAGLFAHHSNTGDTTADGLALAYRAGASLRDLEFVQFHPLMAVRPIRGILPTTLFDDGAVLRNRDGDRFLPTVWNMEDRDTPRDVMSRAIAQEVEGGRGVSGGVFLDLSGISEQVGSTQFGRLWQALRRRGHDPAREPVPVRIAPHFAMGGIWIDADCATDVPGLYAAGEVSGGLHGANRLGGNALTEAVVMGRTAARTVARAGRSSPQVSPVPPELGGEDPALGRSVRKAVREVLWRYAGVTRSAAGLRRGLACLEEWSASLSATRPGHEANHALCVARLILLSALQREESRGAHVRLDFPDTRADWQGSLRVVQSPVTTKPALTFIPSRS